MQIIVDCDKCKFIDSNCPIYENVEKAKNSLMNLEIDLDDSSIQDIPEDGAWQYYVDGEDIHLKCKLYDDIEKSKTIDRDFLIDTLNKYPYKDILILPSERLADELLYNETDTEENRKLIADEVDNYRKNKIVKMNDVYSGISLLKYYSALVSKGYRLVSKISTRLLDYDVVSYYKDGILIVARFNREDSTLISIKVFLRAKITNMDMDVDKLKSSVKFAEMYALEDFEGVFVNIIIEDEDFNNGLLAKLEMLYEEYQLEFDNNPDTFSPDENYIEDIIEYTGISVPKFDKLTYSFLENISSDAYKYIEEKIK